jgi:hypothetical protein
LTNSIHARAAERISDAAEAALEAATEAIGTGRHFVNATAGKIGHATRELRGGAWTSLAVAALAGAAVAALGMAALRRPHDGE